MRCLVTLALLIALPGCELLPLTRTEPHDGKGMMMMADLVPLASEKDVYADDTMRVPVEPSPFELNTTGRPAAMLSDIQPPRSPAGKPKDSTWQIPAEPIP